LNRPEDTVAAAISFSRTESVHQLFTPMNHDFPLF
jgi:hypothetical protein